MAQQQGRQCCDIHFVGSVPLASGREVFETLARRFGPWLAADSRRRDRRTHQLDIISGRCFARHPDFQRIEGPADPRSGYRKARANRQVRDLKPGANTAGVFGDLGYARVGDDSTPITRRLRASGIIAKGRSRYMVALPSPYNVISFCIMPESHRAPEISYEARLLQELDEILANIPHERSGDPVGQCA